MKLFHRTHSAVAILKEGFRDTAGTYGTGQVFQGVWLSNIPLDINQGAAGDTLLVINIPEEVVAEHEWIEEGKPYREFLVPAEIVNRYGPPRIVSQEEELEEFI